MNCKVKIALMFLSAILLVGCETPAERAAWARQEEQYRQEKCSGYGFQRGTTAFSQCLQIVEQQRSLELEEERQGHLRRAQCYLSPSSDRRFKLCP